MASPPEQDDGARRRVLPVFDHVAGRKQRRRDAIQLILTGLALALVLVGIASLGGRSRGGLQVMERVEEVVLDYKFRFRGPVDPSPAIALLVIDEATVEHFGQFPFDRQVFGDAFAALDRLGVDQVLVDFVFSEAAAGTEDTALLAALEQADLPVILGYFFYTDSAGGLAALPRHQAESFQAGAVPMPAGVPAEESHVLRSTGVQPVLGTLAAAGFGVGFLNVRVDHGGIVRRGQLAITHGGQVYPAAEVVSAGITLLGAGGRGSPAYLSGGALDPVLCLADRRVPLDPSGAALINYPGPSGTFPQVSLIDLLQGEDEPQQRARLAEALEGRTVLFGPSAVGIWDRRDTPYGAATPSVEIHAAILDNLLEDRFLRRPPGLLVAEWLLLLLSGVLVTLLMARVPVWYAAGLSSVVVLAVVIIDLAVLFPAGMWVKWLLPGSSLLLLFFVLVTLRSRQEARLRRLEREARAQVEQLFGRYVAPDVVQEMLQHPENVRIGGERREISMLFSDVRGFTTISERGDPEAIAAVLNQYFTAMSDAIQEHCGMIDKYMGDGIMALFGAPLPDEQHAARACAAALAKLTALQRLNDRLVHLGLLDEPLRIGIGVNSGFAAVGNMGSADRFEYTAIGDEVNLGSRLEGMTKQLGVTCIVSDATRKAAGERFHFREIDRVRVKGRDTAVTVHELLSTGGPHLAIYEKALALFRARRWDEAEQRCHEVLDLSPDDGPARLLLGRIQVAREDPPPPGWTGSFKALTK